MRHSDPQSVVGSGHGGHTVRCSASSHWYGGGPATATSTDEGRRSKDRATYDGAQTTTQAVALADALAARWILVRTPKSMHDVLGSRDKSIIVRQV